MSAPADLAPILADKFHEAPSAFTPESLLREARRQKGVETAPVPSVCILDPDGDIVRLLRAEGHATREPAWVCYHTDLFRFSEQGLECGIIGFAVGAPFAILLAEQLFASGCKLLISMTSAGRLKPVRPPPYFVLIERALRDEGTSYHYLPPTPFANADKSLLDQLSGAFDEVRTTVVRGAVWTTDAPYRETEAAIERRTRKGLLAVEMEAAALYAFAEARQKPVVCFAHVTNQMGQAGDFEKGEADGATDALKVILAAARRLGQWPKCR